MARYIPQHLFDALVIERLMSELAGSDDVFNDLLNRYRATYPDEDGSALVADVNAAATYGRDLLAEMPAATSRDKMAALEQMLDILKEDVARDRPLWRRMVENFFSNAQPAPIPDRVHRAHEHLLAAREAWIARSSRASLGSVT